MLPIVSGVLCGNHNRLHRNLDVFGFDHQRGAFGCPVLDEMIDI
jgi:hypothetical protein